MSARSTRSVLGKYLKRHKWRIARIAKLKFDYLKKEKSFQSEIKNIFLVSQVLAFRHTKQNSKNVADTQPLSIRRAGDQASKGSARAFLSENVRCFPAFLSCCFSEIYCTFWFRQMFNGLWISNFDFYWSLDLQFSFITVRLSEGRFLLM